MPEQRGRGVGQALLTTLLLAAADAGPSALSLSVEPTNYRAIALYERLDFATVGEDGGSWRMRRNRAWVTEMVAISSLEVDPDPFQWRAVEHPSEKGAGWSTQAATAFAA